MRLINLDSPGVFVTLAVACLCIGPLSAMAGDPDTRDLVEDPAFWSEVAELAKLSGTDEPAPAVCWLNEGSTNVLYDSGNFSTYETRRLKMVILDAKRAEEYGDVAIPCSKSASLSNLKARTVARSGKAFEVKKSDIHERSRFPDFVLYADVSEKVFAMPSFSDSCVIEYEFIRTSSGTQFEDEFRFDMSIPVRRAEYTFSMPKDFSLLGVDITTRSCGAPKAPVKGARPGPEAGAYGTGTVSTLTWTCSSLPAIPHEPLMAPFADLCSRVTVGLSRMLPEHPKYTWASFGKEYYEETIEPLLKEGRSLGGQARAYLRNPRSELETIEMIGNGVAENIRYVAIEIKGSGWKPHHPEEVLEVRYGDCKDMSVLTAALLRAVGIDAWPALVRTSDQGTIDATVVTPSLMNHMIVFVRSGGQEYWLDPTGGAFNLGELPSVDRDVLAFVLTDEECSFVRTPAADADANRLTWDVTAQIGADGSVTGGVRAEFAGDLALEMRGLMRTSSREDTRKALERMLAEQVAGAHVTTWDEAEARDGKGCAVSLTFSSDAAIPLAGSRVVLDGAFFGISGPEETLHAGDRHHGVMFDRPYSMVDSCSVQLPEGWVAEGLPPLLAVPSKFGSYARQFWQSDGAITCTRKFELTARAVAASEYPDLRSFWLAAAGAQKEPVLLLRQQPEEGR